MYIYIYILLLWFRYIKVRDSILNIFLRFQHRDFTWIRRWYSIFLDTTVGQTYRTQCEYFYIFVGIIYIAYNKVKFAELNVITYFKLRRLPLICCLQVWYNAVTQVFFSLTVCTGPIIMFSSYNNFRQNVYRYVVWIRFL